MHFHAAHRDTSLLLQDERDGVDEVLGNGGHIRAVLDDDEEVLEASRKAALQTNFNYDSSAENPMSGTITYTFKKL